MRHAVNSLSRILSERNIAIISRQVKNQVLFMLTWTLYLPVWDCSFIAEQPDYGLDVVEDERGEEVLPDAYFACPAEYLDLQLVLAVPISVSEFQRIL